MSKSKQQIKFEADVSGFKANIKQAQNSIKTLNNELKLNQSQLKGNTGDTKLLTERIQTLKQKYEEQKEVVENTRKAYEKAVEIFGENSKEAQNLKNQLLQAQTAEQNIKNEIEKTNKQLEEQENKLVKIGKKWQESGERLKDYGSKIESVGNKLSILSGLVGGIAVASLKASIDFESAFTGVLKTVDGTEQQLAELRKGILDMSTEIPSTATEISAVAEAAGQLGIQTENVLDFTRVMIDLGNSTNVSADEAASSLAKFANVTKMSANDYQKLGSVIVELGNNYATTEADIISMAQNLASAGTQVGMSQSDIMALAASLSSVGLEAQAGGTAFSKALIKMQLAVETNSKDLKDWADVAGMSTKEFAKLFKEDATGALQAFIKGLSECGEETESAIKVLDDMGITETRMRDALLRSANASDTFTSAIEMGSKAWKDNTALTNEANKRYETTESQMKMLKNEVVKTAIEFGDELAPSLRQIVKDAKPMLNTISSAVKAFANLDDKTKKSILTVGAFVVGLGPVTKVGGNVIKTIGSVKTGIGTLTGAIGVLKKGTDGASESSIKLASSIKSVASPTGIVTLAVAGLAAAYGIVKKSIDEATAGSREYAEECKKSAEEIREAKEANDALRASIDSNVQSELSHIDRTQALWEELQKITDENGKVKEGYETRAKVITGELSNALDTEITMTDNVIDKYKELRGEIDNVILKKRAEAVMAGYEEKRSNAIANRTQKTQELISKQNELARAEMEEADAYQAYLYAVDDMAKGRGNSVELLWNVKEAKTNWENAKSSVTSLSDAVSNLDIEVKNYTKDIEDADYASELFYKGDAESLQELTDLVDKTYTKDNKTVELSYKKRLEAQMTYLNDAKARNEEAVKNNDEAEKQKTQSSINESKRRIEATVEEIKGQTVTVGENSKEVIDAWKYLATNCYDVYEEELGKMSPDMQLKIQEMTGVVINEIPTFASVMKTLAKEGVSALDKDTEFKEKALKSLNGYLAGMTDEEKRNILKQAGIDDVDIVMKGLEEGNLSEEKGIAILTELSKGMSNSSQRSALFGQARELSKELSGILSVKATISATIQKGASVSNVDGSHKSGLDYVPYDNYVARLHKGERVLTAEENKEYMTDNLSNKISNNNIVVQFFPQSMSETELQRAENYIARKWGMAL